MRVITRKIENFPRDREFLIVPIGDIHIGAAACDEGRLKADVARIADNENAYWIGMGDYCDFITPSDPRFSSGGLAKWVTIADLVDLPRAQKNRFIDIIKPIASKCLCLVEGNHETAITRHYERHIYGEIVTAVKEAGGFEPEYNLALGYTGWLKVTFHRYSTSKRKGGSWAMKFKLHHGFVGGRLAGAKALNMQRVLWANDCDVAIMGHSHNTSSQVEAVERLTGGNKVKHIKRYGLYSGTYLRSFNDGPATYSEVKGYFPMPNAGAELLLRPGAENHDDRIKVVTR